MIRAVSYSVCVTVNVAVVLVICSDLFAQSVRFDCPAVASGNVLDQTVDSKIVEVVLPVSATVADSKLRLAEIKTEIFWNRNAYPLADYEPKTALRSNYDGLISVEKSSETKLNVGATLSSGYFDFMTPSLEANAGKKNSQTTRYTEIPEHDLVIASGPIKRGTGAYFQFKPSRTESLEGGRDLIVAFQVPASWRGGVLQVTCQAVGKRRAFGFFNEEFEYARVFVVPIFLSGDDQARQTANQFSRCEQRLRQGWRLYRAGKQGENSRNLIGLVATSSKEVPDLWMHHLIQSGTDVALKRFESRLPEKISSAANQFIKARQELLLLSR